MIGGEIYINTLFDRCVIELYNQLNCAEAVALTSDDPNDDGDL